MEKKFFVLFFVLLMGVAPQYKFLGAKETESAKSEDEFDIDKWLKEIGIDPGPKEAKPGEPPKALFEAPPEKPEEPKETPEEVAEKVKEAREKLEKFAKLLDSTIQYALDVNLFFQGFREKINKYIQMKIKAKLKKTKGKLEKLSKGPQTDEAEKEFFESVSEISGANGLLVLIKTVLSGTTYLEAFDKKILNNIKKKSTELEKIKNDIKDYKKNKEELKQITKEEKLAIEKKKTFGEELTEKEKRLLAGEKSIIKTREKLETRLLDTFKKLPPIINKIKKIFADPAVQKKIHDERIRRGKGEPSRDYYYPGYSRFGDDSGDWPPGFRPDDYYKQQGDYEGDLPSYDYLPPLPPTDDDIKPTDDKDEEDKKKYERVKKKKKDDKKKKEAAEKEKKKIEAEEKKRIEKAKATEILNKAANLINEICKDVNPESSVIDSKLKDILLAENEKINSLKLAMDEAVKRNKAKASAFAEATADRPAPKKKELYTYEDETKEEKKKRKAEEKKKAEEEKIRKEIEEKQKHTTLGLEKSQKNFNQTLINNIEKLVLLCKYGYAETAEKPDGRFVVLSKADLATDDAKKIIPGQENLRLAYEKAKSILTQTEKKNFNTKESSFFVKINKEISTGVAKKSKALELIIADLDVERPLIVTSYGKLNKTKTDLVDILRYNTAANNKPMPTKIKAKNINANLLKEAQVYFTYRFSSALQKLLMKAQEKQAQKILNTTKELDNEEINKALSEHIGKQRKEALTFFKTTKSTDAKSTLERLIAPFLAPDKDTEWTKEIKKKSLFKTAKEIKKKFSEKKKIFAELREALQYHQTIKNLNELDILKVTIDKLQKDTNWWKKDPHAPHDVEILEALWTWEKPQILKKDMTIKVPNPHLCDVRTVFWQDLVNKTINELKSKAKKPKELKLPSKIETKMFADLTDRGKTEKKPVLKKFHEKLKRGFKHFFMKTKRFFAPVKKENLKERYLLMIYRVGKKRYVVRFTGDQNVTLDQKKKHEIKADKEITWKLKG